MTTLKRPFIKVKGTLNHSSAWNRFSTAGFISWYRLRMASMGMNTA